MSYAVDGRQYIAVLVGYGGSAAIMSEFLDVGWKFNAQPRRLLSFALDGQAQLPPTPGPDLTVHALDDPELELDENDVKSGAALFNMMCSSCHGLNLRSAGAPGPDLRESGIALHLDTLWAVLHDGILMPRGMPRFDRLSPTQARQIHAYIRAGAREVLGRRAPSSEKAGATAQ